MSVRKCFAQDSNVTLSDNSHKQLKSLKVGDKVKTLDSNGNLIDTDVIMIMDKSLDKCKLKFLFICKFIYFINSFFLYQIIALFLNIKTYSNKTLSVSGSHLIPLSNGDYKYAKRLIKDEIILSYDYEKNMQVEEKIKSVLIEPIEGYVAPLTMAGTILVNDVLASCYAVVDSHRLAHVAMSPVRWWYTFERQLNQKKFNSFENGTHWYPQALMSLSETLLSKFIKLD